MEPTLGDHGEYIVEDRLSYKLRPESIARGDLVTLKSPLDPFRTVCKRVIGLAGDVICVDPTGVMAPSTEHVMVPKGHVWLSGDNAAMSRDSREYGPVSTALIQGKLYARVSKSIQYSKFSRWTNRYRSGLWQKPKFFLIRQHFWTEPRSIFWSLGIGSCIHSTPSYRLTQ